MSDLVLLHVMLSSEQMADFERFRGNRSKKEAARELIALGLRAAEDSTAGQHPKGAR